MNRENSKQLVKEVIGYFSELGELTSRSMFGGYGICQNAVMFGLVSEGKFYLRANDHLESIFINHGMSQFIYQRRGTPIPLRYYHVNKSIWKQRDIVQQFAIDALSSALVDMYEKQKQEQEDIRLKDLPNLNITIERMLRQIGIQTRQELVNSGALETYIKLRAFKHDIKPELLFSLAGAIEGCHVAVLPDLLRNRLAEQLRIYDQARHGGNISHVLLC
ncbi:MAG: TfoX/Sxy family DNA transformation protein [Enterobacteriaceae bacterium]|jgi:DNA transformation protein|nr:TfoX/Sxy family DNA transformation protein [Enterobacteriaceae bacterium]